MAGTATATYTTDVWTSSSVDGSQWEYAVPIRQDSINHRSKSRSSRESHARSKERNSKGSRSSSLSRHAHAHEHFNSRGRREFSQSRRGSEAESSRSIYGHDIGSPRAGNAKDSADALYRKGSVRQGDRNEGIGLYLNEFDQDNWIHRDKLAKIESEELHQAAILLQRRAGAEGTKTGRAKNHDSYGASGTPGTSPPTEQLEPWPSLLDDPRSPTLSEGSERQAWDLRRPEEIAAEKTDDGASGFYRNPGQGKSSSRIPVPTASPATISPGHAGREFPMQRTRALTNGDDEVLSFGMPRRASEPMSVDSASNITPAGSRPGSRGNTLQNAAGKKTTVKGATNRKTSAPPATRKATPRSRVPSSTQRAGKGDNRPINRPEGDPPWLATMYKPDPRLPPEQQILPTHARRMQQEQWVKEGKTPTTYDREFAPLAIGHDGPIRMEKLAPKEGPELDPANAEEEKEKGKEKEKEEPALQRSPSLKKSPSLQAPKGSEPGRPNSSTGYSTMPRVQEPPMAALQPKWSPPVVTAQEPPPKEKGCGCCIVM